MSVQQLWTPDGYHGYHRRGPFFEGWYVKIVDATRTHKFAFIPGIFKTQKGEEDHAFLQFLNGSSAESEYLRYPTHAFLASASNFNVRVGRQHFFDQGLDLDLHAVRANGEPLAIEGHVSFIDPQPWPVRPLSPGIMGPFSFVPFMECNHGVVSLDHELRGELVINGERVPFDGGRGYIEKDWGRSFPSSYVWMQSNHFGRDGVSLTASVANIPWLWSRFTGSIIGLLVDGRLYRFATYTGARVAKLEVSDETVHLVVRDLDKVLEIEARRSHGAPLMAPYEHQMLERVSETMTSRIEVRLAKRRPGRGREIFAGVTENAALEVQGQLEEIVTS